MTPIGNWLANNFESITYYQKEIEHMFFLRAVLLFLLISWNTSIVFADKYAEIGKEYVKVLQQIIKQNNLKMKKQI